MKIYLDILVLTNLILTIGLLSCCGRLTSSRLSPKRTAAAGLIGSLCSLIWLIDAGSFPAALFIILLKLCGLAAVIFVAFRPAILRRFALYTFVYLGIEILFGGLCMVMWELTGSQVILYKNYIPYLDVPLWIIALSIAFCYVIISAAEHLMLRRQLAAKQYRIRFSLGDYEVTMPGVCDTGNMLEDVFTGTPVVIFSSSELYEHFALDESEKLFIKGFHLVPYSTVDGTRLIAVTAKGRVTVFEGESFVKEADCSAGILDSKSPARAIFNPQILL